MASELEDKLRRELRIVLVRPQHPGNVGAAARAMKNMGLRQLVVVAAPCLDLEQARWMATSASDLLDQAQFVGSVQEAIADCQWAVGSTARWRRWDWEVLEPEPFARRALSMEGSCAVLFGQEDKGLDNEAMAACQALLRIPTDGLSSLNLSQAVMLVCSELFREARRLGWEGRSPDGQGRRSGGAPLRRQADPDPLSALESQQPVLEMALELLRASGYMAGRSEEQVQVTLGRLLQKTQTTTKEILILRGMLKKLLRQQREGSSASLLGDAGAHRTRS